MEAHALNAAAETYVEAQKAIFDAYHKKSNGGMSLMYSLQKYFQLRYTYDEAAKAPYQMHQELKKGAVAAFLDGRPENLQHMIAHPQEFLESQYQNAKDCSITLLIQLTGKMPDAGVPLPALAKVDKTEQ